jgi:hypothetical protein
MTRRPVSLSGTRLVRALLIASFITAACTDRLPDQDLRILSASPVERLSAAVLWDDFHKSAADASARYHGRAIVVTGAKPELGSGQPGQRFVRFVVADSKGAVRANLLDEQAEAILGAAKESPRVTLKCFCDGLAGAEVVLRSCVMP